MAGLGPAIHEKPLVDPRAKPGEDGLGVTADQTGNLSPSGGAATSKALTTPDSMPK